MGKPSAELLPSCAEFVPRLVGHLETLLLIAPEHIVELTGGGFVDNDGILLEITLQAARIKIGAAPSTIIILEWWKPGL